MVTVSCARLLAALCRTRDTRLPRLVRLTLLRRALVRFRRIVGVGVGLIHYNGIGDKCRLSLGITAKKAELLCSS